MQSPPLPPPPAPAPAPAPVPAPVPAPAPAPAPGGIDSDDSDDDSYYDRLQAAAIGDPGEEAWEGEECREQTTCSDNSIDKAKPLTEEEEEYAYFEKLQREGEVDSHFVLAEDDPVWAMLAEGLLRNTAAASVSATATASAAASATPAAATPAAAAAIVAPYADTPTSIPS
jgi:hypothetical protein